jgi:hypothetical protein
VVRNNGVFEIIQILFTYLLTTIVFSSLNLFKSDPSTLSDVLFRHLYTKVTLLRHYIYALSVPFPTAYNTREL